MSCWCEIVREHRTQALKENGYPDRKSDFMCMKCKEKLKKYSFIDMAIERALISNRYDDWKKLTMKKYGMTSNFEK